MKLSINSSSHVPLMPSAVLTRASRIPGSAPEWVAHTDRRRSRRWIFFHYAEAPRASPIASADLAESLAALEFRAVGRCPAEVLHNSH